MNQLEVSNLNTEDIVRTATQNARRHLNLCSVSEEIKEMMASLHSSDEKERVAAQERLLDKEGKLLNACETESYVALLESLDCHYHDKALELMTQFIKENNCVTLAEKMQAEIIVGTFIRILGNSRRLNEVSDQYHMPTKERNNLITLLIKQVDLCTRQFHSALATFKCCRTTAVSLNIKTNNAFVAQNIHP